MKHSLLALIFWSMFLGAPKILAAETDFLPDNINWNGFSEFAEIAHGLQLQMTLLEELDWAALPKQSTLFLIHPQTPLDKNDILAFLQQGGKLLIANEHSEADGFLDALGIQQMDGQGIRAERLYQGNPHLPIAQIGPMLHPLNTGVNEIITNHPSYFFSRLPTLAGFSAGKQQILVVGHLGKGIFVVLSDPSVFINAMLRFEGNLTLATNSLRYLAPPQGNPLYLVTGHFRVTSHFRPSFDSKNQTDSAQQFLSGYNAFLGTLNNFALTVPAIRLVSFVCGSVTIIGLLFLLPYPHRSSEGKWLRPQGSPRWDYEDQVKHFCKHPNRGRATFPAIVLREELDEILSEFFKSPGPILTLHPKWVVNKVKELAGNEAAHICSRLLEQLRKIPLNVRVDENLFWGKVLHKDLAHAYDLSQKLLFLLGKPLLPALTSYTREDVTHSFENHHNAGPSAQSKKGSST